MNIRYQLDKLLIGFTQTGALGKTTKNKAIIDNYVINICCQLDKMLRGFAQQVPYNR